MVFDMQAHPDAPRLSRRVISSIIKEKKNLHRVPAYFTADVP